MLLTKIKSGNNFSKTLTAILTAKASDNTDNRDDSHTKSSYYRRKRELLGGFRCIQH